MEKHEVAHIEKNPSLAEKTLYSSMVLARLKAAEILTNGDIQKIRAEYDRNGDISAMTKFYEIMVTKEKAFESLKKVLKEERQTGALAILNELSPLRKRLTKGNGKTSSKKQKVKKEPDAPTSNRSENAALQATTEETRKRKQNLTQNINEKGTKIKKSHPELNPKPIKSVAPANSQPVEQGNKNAFISTKNAGMEPDSSIKSSQDN